MRQLNLFEEERGIQLKERLATTLIQNPAYGEVTSHMELGGRSCQAATKVKVLSPERTIVPEAEAVHLAEGSTLRTARRRGERGVAGSEAGAWQQRDSVGTREAQSVSRGMGICESKPGEGKPLQKTLWESDQPIVVRKLGNASGAKGLAGMVWEGRDTSSTLRGGERKSTKLSSLSVRAGENPHLRFTSLAHLLTVDFLRECFRELKRGKAPGVDGVRVEEYEADLEENLKDLVGRIRRKCYRPQPVRRVYILKPKGGERPLGIPTVEDKLVQMGLKKILEAIFEVDFLDVSFGFRPRRNCHQALEVLDKAVMRKPVNYIVDMDIEKFFDSVDHGWMMKFLKVRISDPNILRLVGRFLRAGVMEEGKYYEVDKGTPQGGILSPLLANIYLHYSLDIWFEKRVKRESRGYAQLIRYSDDFVVCFQKAEEARGFGRALRERLRRYGIRVAEEKSRVLPFGRLPYEAAQEKGKKLATFDFLGFTHYCTRTRRGYFKLGRKTAKERFRQRIKETKQWLKDVRGMMKLKDWWEVLRLKLTGHYSYYGISGNMAALKAFYREVTRLAFKWANRRSQKRSYNWECFKRFLQFNPLPKPKIYHLTYSLFSNGGHITEEPYAGNPQVRFCEGH